MESILIIFAIIYLIISFAACFKFADIAAMKGHDSKSYFWWCFFGGLLGAMMVIALPAREPAKHVSASEIVCQHCKTRFIYDENAKSVHCPYCNERVK